MNTQDSYMIEQYNENIRASVLFITNIKTRYNFWSKHMTCGYDPKAVT